MRLLGVWEDISTHSLTKRLTDVKTQLRTQLRYFNSQPHEEADKYFNIFWKYCWHFNSQPHEEADGLDDETKLKSIISTHSLTKRLTSVSAFKCMVLCISTHSLTKRLTVRFAHEIVFHRHFNSQPHEEADAYGTVFIKPNGISTHSLTKRLTSVRGVWLWETLFQLTASRRGWLFSFVIVL